VHKIRQSKRALEGERKHITVLFADVKGSMNLSAQFDPEQWFSIVEDFFEVVAEGVHRFEGTVHQFTGDGVMALFGAPVAHEDHAQRACLAALHIRDAVRTFAESIRLRHGVQFSVRMGLNSDEVVIGRITDDLSMDFAALGHGVGLAQRMESLAEPGHICLSENTARLVDGYFQLRDLGRTEVKGVAEPMGLFDLEGAGTFRTRLDRSRARGLSAFVGRDRDLDALEAAFERASDGGQVVGVMAEAGTGKSRLCAEFVERCRSRGITVLEARGVAHGKAIPMLPMLELWRGVFRIGEEDNADAVRAKISGTLLSMDERYREDLPVIFDLFSVTDPTIPSPPADIEQRQKRLHSVVKRVLHDPVFRSGGPRVTLLEDLHWFDGASNAFLETMVEAMPATRDLLLVNFRPDYQARWMHSSHYQHMTLQPLGTEATSGLLRDYLGQDPSVAALPEMIQERTKGNPFFIEEVLQSLVERGHLTGARGAYRLTAPLAALYVPESVRALLESRIDRLAEREKHVLQTASVIGNQFSESLLSEVLALLREALANLADPKAPSDAHVALDQALAALQAAEFLFEATVWPEVEYSFRHPLTQEVAQNSQLHARRIRVHAAVARALEAAGGNLDERAAEIALHWSEAEELGNAALWHRRAAVWAGLSDPHEGLRHWRRVRELAGHVAEERSGDELALEACSRILALGWRGGFSPEEAESVFKEGRALAERRGDPLTVAVLLSSFGTSRMSAAGSAADYVRCAEEAEPIFAAMAQPAVAATLGAFPMYAYVFAGYGAKVIEIADRVFAAVGSDYSLGKELIGFSPRLAAMQGRTVGLMYAGRLNEAEAQCQEGLKSAESLGEAELLGWLDHAATWVAYTRGDTASVLDHGRRSLEIAMKINKDSSLVIAYFSLGNSHLMAGEAGEACEALLSSAAIARDRNTFLAFLPQVLSVLAEAQLAVGKRTEAEASSREAIARARAGGCDYYEAHAQLSLAEILLAADGRAAAGGVETALNRAEDLVEKTAGRSLSPRILELRGRLAAARGDAKVGAALLKKALDLYRAIGATGQAARLARDPAQETAATSKKNGPQPAALHGVVD
jgi:class 3 adenylate cyclase